MRSYRECSIGNRYILVLDHRTLEVFDRQSDRSSPQRWHVSHVGVEAQPEAQGLLVRIGLRTEGGKISGTGGYAEIHVTAGEKASVHHFFDAVRAARDISAD
ncbi:hypothetical protein [Hoyosella subflava]|uniref:hypothetical protein n=1 Tax=Hoyosella subflava TaxID=639313 RepID=UPI00059C2861|nr:hypothetical protein [Hoyosella subflava]